MRDGSRLTTLGARLEWTLVATACALNLWILRTETWVVPNFNDSSLHLAMIRWARYQADHGRVPLSGWYPHMSTGSALFTSYQTLAHLIGTLASYVVGVDAFYYWSLYLLLALWPLSVYWGGRLLALDRWSAALAALAAPLMVSVPHYGFEDTSFTWWGLGMWSQLWGMWALPIVLGVTWRAIDRRGSMAVAALALGLLVCLHFMTAYLAFAALAAWVFLGGRPIVRAGRACLIGLGAFATALWAVVPVIGGAAWHPSHEFERGTFWINSYPLSQILGWLVHGQLFDAGRLPVVSVAAGVGLAVCVFLARRERTSRALLALGLVSLFLYSGRATWGSLVDVMPGAHDLYMHRYLMGVQLSAIWMAGVGLAWTAHFVAEYAGRLPGVRMRQATTVCLLASAFVLAPGWQQVAVNRGYDAGAKTVQQAADRAQLGDVETLLAIVRTRGGGRVYAGSSGNWGQTWKIGYVPLYNVLENEDADSVGFLLRVPAVISDAEAYFDPGDPGQYDVFDVRYLLLPPGQRPVVKADLVAALPAASLWEIHTSGYMEIADTIGPAWDANRDEMGSVMRRLAAAHLPDQHLYPVLRFPSTPVGDPTATPGVTGSPGNVLGEHDGALDGEFDATVELNRPSAVILKASYDPGWVAIVDGRRVTPYMVAPAYPAVNLTAGPHTVRWVWESHIPYPLLFLAGAVVIALLARFDSRAQALLAAWDRRRARAWSALLGPHPQPADDGDPSLERSLRARSHGGDAT